MSAYVVFQSTVIDRAKLSDYAAQAMATVAAHGGRPFGMGEATVLHEAKTFEQDAVFEFPDRANALAWHTNVEYRALLSLRTQAMACSVVLIG